MKLPPELNDDGDGMRGLVFALLVSGVFYAAIALYLIFR